MISKLTGGKNGKPRLGILREKLYLDFAFRLQETLNGKQNN